MTKYQELLKEMIRSGNYSTHPVDGKPGVVQMYVDLAGVLRWVVSEVNPGKSGDVLSFFFCFYVGDDGFEFHEENKWDLTKDLEGQSEEVIDFLLSLKND